MTVHSAPVTELIERDGELVRLAAAADAARGGEGVLVLIEGPAGIGKSRLAAEATELAIERGFAVLSACGGEFEHDVTYGIARQLFERYLRGLDPKSRDALLAGPAGLAVPAIGEWRTDLTVSAETGIDHGLYWLVANLAEQRPVALIVDDAHWADAPSLRSIAYLARRLEGLRVLVVLAARVGEPGSDIEVIRHVVADAGARRMTLAPLSQAGSRELVSRRLGRALPGAAARVCHEMSGGNPFFLGELAGALQGAGGRSESSLIADIRLLAPPAVSLSILLRVSRLGGHARSVADALSVVGDGARLALLCAVAELDEQVVVEMLDELADAAITTRDDKIGFLHPIVRTVIYQDLPGVVRARLHRRAGRWLIGAHAPVEQVAHHLALAEPIGDGETLSILTSAATRAARRGAHESAVGLLVRALAEPPAPDVRPAVLTVLGEEEFRTGRLEGAVAHLREALDGEAEPEVRERAALALGGALAATGSTAQAFEVLKQEAWRLSGEQALRLEVERATIGMWVRAITPMPWLPAMLESFARLRGTTPSERLALTQSALAFAFERQADREHAAELARRALADGALLAEHGSDSVAVAMACYVLALCEDFEAARAVTAAMLKDARNSGSVLGFVAAFQLDGSMELAVGDLANAAAHSEAAWDAALALGDSPIAQRAIAFAESWLVEALLMQGDLPAARAAVARGAAAGDFERDQFVWARYGRGLVRLEADGDAAGAVEDLLAVGRAAEAGGYEDRGTPWRLWAAQALAAAGETAASHALADQQLQIAETWGAPGGLGAALRVRALIGDPAEAEPLLERAVQVLSGSAHRLEHARAAVDYGVALRRAGRRTGARTSLAKGLELAGQCGAMPLVERARSELYVLGTRPRRLMFSGIEGLTASERRVAALAAGGRSNREIAQALFITPKTVENHLASVYRKLGVKTRRDLPRELAAES
jgi:DNA-binding CsgD family transcriptional regulator